MFVILAVQLLEAGLTETHQILLVFIDGCFAAHIQSQPYHQMPVAEFALTSNVTGRSAVH